jgi:hypothetical protein
MSLAWSVLCCCLDTVSTYIKRKEKIHCQLSPFVYSLIDVLKKKKKKGEITYLVIIEKYFTLVFHIAKLFQKSLFVIK